MSNNRSNVPANSPSTFFCYDGLLLPVAGPSFGGSGGGTKKTYLGIKSIMSGGLSGVAQVLVTYPMEYIKTQIQLDEKGHSKLYNGSWDCTIKTFRDRGIFGFYRGMGVLLLACIPKAGVRFYVLECLRNMFEDSKGQLTTGMKLFCGLAAGTAEAVVAVTPFETVKVKFINNERSSNPQYRGLVHGVSEIIKNEGIRGIYQGLTPTILKEATNQAMRFFVVESLKDIYTGGDRSKTVPIGWTGLFGAVAGAISVCGNNPLDVIKTRMQGLEAARYKNTWDCTQKIWTQEGIAAFYKGVYPRMLRVSVDVAITFIVYDKIMELFHRLF